MNLVQNAKMFEGESIYLVFNAQKEYCIIHFRSKFSS